MAVVLVVVVVVMVVVVMSVVEKKQTSFSQLCLLFSQAPTLGAWVP